MMRQFPHIIFVLAFLPLLVSCSNQNKTAQTSQVRNIIIDADTGNEIDDLFAIVRALLEPSFNIKAISSAQYHIYPNAPENTVQISQYLNEQILQLMDSEHISHPLGSNLPLPDVSTPRPSAAASLIIDLAHSTQEDEMIDIVVLGAMTNVASAILMDSTIIEKIRVHIMGLTFNPVTKEWGKDEFNTNNDIHAMNVLLDARNLDLQVMTGTASRSLVYYRDIAHEKLEGQGGVWDLLVQRWEDYLESRTWGSPDQNEWVMWDIAIIEALVHPEFATKISILTPPENDQRHIEVYTEINVEAMKQDYWAVLAEGMK